jgi:ABC-type Fe3+/spermidine/putrescine transport system ATPase subunit
MSVRFSPDRVKAAFRREAGRPAAIRDGAGPRPDVILQLRGLGKRFGATPVVRDVDLEVHRGEFMLLLGPSGCGKTTTLRLIAGLEQPSTGDVAFEGRPVVSVSRRINLPPHKRNVGMVFQSYALWPHMTVAENVEYPLRLRRFPRSEIRTRVERAIAMVGLEGFGRVSVTRLSGGQQQRVALARALVYEPALLLLDEPFSNLDAHLREETRVEVRLLQKRLQMTAIMVTHDQEEALSVADRIAVMSHGRIEQVGTPQELYDRPATRFVRDFLGRSVKLLGVVKDVAPDGRRRVALQARPDTEVLVPVGRPEALEPGAEVELSVRPEHLRVVEPAADLATLPVAIEALLFRGDHYEARVSLGEQAFSLELPRDREWAEGQPLYVRLPETGVALWPLAP